MPANMCCKSTATTNDNIGQSLAYISKLKKIFYNYFKLTQENMGGFGKAGFFGNKQTCFYVMSRARKSDDFLA
jgi:hypothetical protein